MKNLTPNMRHSCQHTITRTLLVALIIIGIAFNTKAQTLTDANSIISKANLAAYYAADDGTAQARMKIVDAKGNKQLRQFTILRKDQQGSNAQKTSEKETGVQDFLVHFSRPSDVKGTVLRVEKQPQSDDNRWLYLPALDLVKRIAASDKRTSFVGSHFFYEDVSGRNPQEDNFTLQSSDNGVYTIKAMPKDPATVEFSHYIIQINQQHFIPMQVDYFDKQNQHYRQMKVLKTKLVGQYTTVMHSRINNLIDGSYTEMQFRRVKYNRDLPQNLFSERTLRQFPNKWLK